MHPTSALPRPDGTPVHRRDADDVDLRLQATRVVQRLESLCQPTGQGRRLRATATRILA